MLHARSDYNRIQDPSGKIPEDEPVFIVRGQDKCAPATCRAWAKEAERIGAAPEFVKLVRDWAKVIEAYQVRTGKCKVPDGPVK